MDGGLRDNRTVVVQLRDELASLIKRGNLSTGDRLPTEAELTSRFRVSRPALREALKLLEQDGVISVVHGKGRFISAMAALHVERPITCFESVTDMVRRFGFQPINRVLSVAEEVPPAEITRSLQMEPGETVIRLERLRLQGDKVIMFCLDRVPRKLIPEPIESVDWSVSLLDILERVGKRPRLSNATASAVALPDDVAERNGLEDFGPAFLVVETAYTETGLAVVHAQDYHRGSEFSFSFVRR